MNIFLTEEQVAIQNAARKFAENEFPKYAEELDEKEEYPFDLWKKACELGFIGSWIKEEYGGPGLGFMENCLINEEFWRVDPGCAQVLSAAFGSELIQEEGNEE